MTYLEWTLRLLLATALAGFVGLEREAQHKQAGMRTHMLVGLGAALFGLLSLEAFDATDPSRIAAQVVTGVGFLGAGAIFKEGMSVRGLTTAAGLWAVAAIGLAAGAGAYFGAVTATVIALTVLTVLREIELRVRRRAEEGAVQVAVTFDDPTDLHRLLEMAPKIDPIASQLVIRTSPEGLTQVIVPVHPDRSEALRAVAAACRGVVDITDIP